MDDFSLVLEMLRDLPLFPENIELQYQYQETVEHHFYSRTKRNDVLRLISSSSVHFSIIGFHSEDTAYIGIASVWGLGRDKG